MGNKEVEYDINKTHDILKKHLRTAYIELKNENIDSDYFFSELLYITIDFLFEMFADKPTIIANAINNLMAEQMLYLKQKMGEQKFIVKKHNTTIN